MPANSLSYTVSLHVEGREVFTCKVPVREVGLIGDYHNGIPYQPDNAATEAALPYRYRKAFSRAIKWWHATTSTGHSVMTCEIHTLRGRSMGRLIATPNWHA